MSDLVRFDLMTVEGPHKVYAFDIDNPTDQVVKLELVRSSGSVVVALWVKPWHVHRQIDEAGEPRWLWELQPGFEIIVPEQQSVTLRAQGDMSIACQLTPWVATQP